MHHVRAKLRRITCALLVCTASTVAHAQSFPTKPIRLIVPLAPGGGGDIISRMIAQKISEPLGQTVVVDNRPGGSTIIGTDIVARSAPDGYTLVMATSSHGINPSLRKLPYDPIKDFTGVAFIASSPMLLVVHPSLPVKTVKELIALAKAKPGQLNYGSSGPASIVHLAGELFNVMTGVKTVHVPYKGSGPAITDLLGGQIQMMFSSPVATVPHVRAGRLRAIAMASTERSPALPELPTVIEAGVPEFTAGTYFIVLGPAGIPPAVVSRLNSEIVKASRLPDVTEKLTSQGAVIVAGSGQQAIDHLKGEIARWTKVVKAADIKVQ